MRARVAAPRRPARRARRLPCCRSERERFPGEPCANASIGAGRTGLLNRIVNGAGITGAGCSGAITPAFATEPGDVADGERESWGAARPRGRRPAACACRRSSGPRSVQRRRVELRGEREGEAGRAPHGARVRGRSDGVGHVHSEREAHAGRSASRLELARGSPAARTPAPNRALPSASVDGLRARERGRGARRGRRGGRRRRGGGARGRRRRRRRCAPLRAAVRHRRVLRLVVRVGGLLLRWRSAHWPPIPSASAASSGGAGTPASSRRRRRAARRLGQRPQSPRRQPSQPPQRSTRSFDGHALARRLCAGEHGERGERRPARVLVGHDRRLARRRVRVARRAAPRRPCQAC